MKEKLGEIFGADYLADRWMNTPIEEWSGFSVREMQGIGFYPEVLEWFNDLTTDQILTIGKRRKIVCQ